MGSALVLALTAALSPMSAEGRQGCSAEDLQVLTTAAAEILRGGNDSVRGDVEQQAEASRGRCADLSLARTAIRGWASARTLAPMGGGGEGHREAIRRLLAGLDQLAGGPLALDAEYADVAVRAAVAAAQDERSELELLLAHARDLAERVSARGRHATWPRPFNLLAGELWLEVDRYDEARAAFERAVREGPSPLALIGLGRSLARLDRHQEACAAFRDVRGAIHQVAEDLRGLLADCR